MSKALEASCVAGIVTVNGIPVPGVEILGAGVASSDGTLILDDDKAYYIPKTTADLEATIEKLIDTLTETNSAFEQAANGLNKAVEAFGKAVSGLTLIDAKPVGGTGSAPAPVAASDITGITAASIEITSAAGGISAQRLALDAIKAELTTLKAALK